MATRLRKSRRQRGSRYCGWGQIGQHRQSGSRGGVGQAGKHKHFWIRTVIEEPDHFGHSQNTSHHKNIVKKWINLRDIESIYEQNKENLKEKNILDLSSLGYHKLLGSGNLKTKLSIKIQSVSKNALTKIQAIGGNVIENGE
ncbi:MAG: 50S ribosomal protein L15 [Nitrososphaeraceae archaeon]|nr:50S ribosomal protein L15 [Nitrososphaeraceae archaeon]